MASPVAALAQTYDRGLLWRVSQAETPASYLYGTMHLADPRLLALPPAAEAAFDRARIFVLELYPDRAVAARFAEASLLDGDMRLDAMLPEPVFVRLRAVMGAKGATTERLRQLKPWAALLLATAAPGGGGQSPDIALYARARMQNKRIEELDSVEEQIAVFDGIPLDAQLGLLEIALKRHDALAGEMEEHIATYLAGDLAGLARIARRNGGDSEAGRRHQEKLEKAIIHDRSVVMAYRLQAYLRRGGAFAAVGALHLYGPKGMLALLAEDGWTVEPVTTGQP
ncbi:MAG: TraB/GumN family protein [Rhodocyclaceae bacterium]|nr:TraB/GumN family protein [Rhodocyclaceae bacterium]